MGQSEEAQVLYIAGAGRSGSTLLDLLLGNHPKIIGLGEVHRVCLNPSERICACGEPINRCRFWRNVLKHVLDCYDLSAEDWPEEFPTTSLTDRKAAGIRDLRLVDLLLLIGSYKLLRTAAQISRSCFRHIRMTENSWRLYDVVAQQHRVSTIVDSSKNAARMKLLYMARPRSLRVIHLVRDGRAVAHSLRRRYGISIKEAALQWKLANRNVELVLKTIPARRRMLIHYEDLCRRPQQVLKKIVRFGGFKSGPPGTELRRSGCHQIPGNRLLFERRGAEIREDRTWESGLSQTDEKQFELAAGSFNRRYGYPATGGVVPAPT